MIDLYAMATVGRRHLASSADGLHARGEPAVETPEALATRAAVAAALPTILTHAGESELTRFVCAALAAACPEAATGQVTDLEVLVHQYDGTSRAPVAALMHGEQLSAVVRDTARSGEVVYLTDQGRRLAAIVPAGLAELLDRGEGTPGRRVLGARAAGRSGRRDISERIEEIFSSEVTP